MEYLRTLKPLFTIPQHFIPIRCIQPRYCSKVAKTTVTTRDKRTTVDKLKSQMSSGPSFQDFIKGASVNGTHPAHGDPSEHLSYLPEGLEMGNSRKVYFETYGCQMNVNDTEIAWSILQKKGYLRSVDL